MTMVKKEIFISSTYLDLKDYREEIWKKITDSYGTVVNIRGMEKFGARTEKPIETCLNEVSESDVFILISGVRYGTIPTARCDGCSFVESEYLKAQDEGLETLIFLFDEENGCVIPDTIDFNNYDKLKDFKNRLKRDHTVESFSTKEELASKIIEALNHLFTKKNWLKPSDSDSWITVGINSTDIHRGDQIEIFGEVYKNTKSVCVWIFGKDRYLSKKVLVNSKTDSYSCRIPSHTTCCFEPGQYYAVIQHPGQNNLYDVFDVIYDDSNILINSISKTNYILKGKNAIYGSDAAIALIDLINIDGIDDKWVRLSFVVC